MFNNGVLSSFMLISLSLPFVVSRAILEDAQRHKSCLYDATAPVTIWPGDSCHLEPTGAELSLPKSEQGRSCPAISRNSKCFPMSQAANDPSEASFDLQDSKSYKTSRVRQAQEQQTVVAGARSISLRWPDEMQHAVFFTDEACHDVETGRPDFTWHVERLGTQIVQCESLPAGLFRSVEYMRQEEYSRRTSRQDRDVKEPRWRGIL